MTLTRVLLSVLAGLSLACENQPDRSIVTYPLRKIAHNIASHGPDVASIGYILANPTVMYTRGDYTGMFGKSDMDLNAIFLGLQPNPLPESPYKPTSLTGSENMTFYSLEDFLRPHFSENDIREWWSSEFLQSLINLEEGEIISKSEIETLLGDQRGGDETESIFLSSRIDIFSSTISFGKEDGRVYMSVYDEWDFKSDGGYYKSYRDHYIVNATSQIMGLLGTTVPFYTRFYLDEHGLTQENLVELKKKMDSEMRIIPGIETKNVLPDREWTGKN